MNITLLNPHYSKMQALFFIFILQIKDIEYLEPRWLGVRVWTIWSQSMLLTATWTAGVRAGVLGRPLSFSIMSRGKPEYEQWEKGCSGENGKIGILVVWGQAGESPFPEPGSLSPSSKLLSTFSLLLKCISRVPPLSSWVILDIYKSGWGKHGRLNEITDVKPLE